VRGLSGELHFEIGINLAGRRAGIEEVSAHPTALPVESVTPPERVAVSWLTARVG
jgi:hypothetical protein